MDFLGVGPLEFFFILLLALLLFGPHDMVKAGKTLGRWLRRLVTSPTWRAVQETSRELSHLPNRLMREAGLEEIEEELKETGQGAQGAIQESLREVQQTSADLSAWTTPPSVAELLPTPSSPGEAAQPADSPTPAPASAPDTSSSTSTESA